MPYGVKQGVKTPGNFTLVDMLGLALSSAAGIIAALVTDFQQSGEASALYTINQWAVQLGSILGYTDIPLWMVVLGMTAVGAGSVFYFQPITRQGAFAQGFGLLAVLMTAIPSDLAGGIESISNPLPGLEAAATSREASMGARVYQASYAAAQYIPAQSGREAAQYKVHLTINFPDGLPHDIDTMIRRGSLRGRLHNEDLNQSWSIFRTSGGTLRRQGNSLFIEAGVPARSNKSRLWVRVEAEGYAIEVQSYDASVGEPVNWVIDMTPSSTPLFMQRLGKSYWF